MRASAVLLAASALIASPAAAYRWLHIAERGNSSFSVDTDALVWDDAVATIWLRTIHLSYPKNKEASAVEKWIHDCENGRAKLIAMTAYKADGSVIISAQVPRYEQSWRDIEPGSINEEVHRKICRWQQEQRGVQPTPLKI
jgi:hypothetical protein